MREIGLSEPNGLEFKILEMETPGREVGKDSEEWFSLMNVRCFLI